MNRSVLFDEGSVVFNLQSIEKESALHELIENASIFRKKVNKQLLEKAVLKRELQQTTGLGHEIAFAHGKTQAVHSLKIALGISKRGINYNSLDGVPVKLLFLIANPPNRHQEYLTVISKLSRIVRNKYFRDSLLNCRCPKEVKQKLDSAIKYQK